MSTYLNPTNNMNWYANFDAAALGTMDRVEDGKVTGQAISRALGDQNVALIREIGLERCAEGSPLTLDAPMKTYSPDRIREMINKAEEFDFSLVLMVLVQTMKELRHAHREARHAERDAAVRQSLNAAEEIRSAAAWTLGASMLIGVTGVVMSGVGLYQSGKQISSTQSSINQAKANNGYITVVSSEHSVNKDQAVYAAAAAQSKSAETNSKNVTNLKEAQVELKRREDALSASSPENRAERQALVTQQEQKVKDLTTTANTHHEKQLTVSKENLASKEEALIGAQETKTTLEGQKEAQTKELNAANEKLDKLGSNATEDQKKPIEQEIAVIEDKLSLTERKLGANKRDIAECEAHVIAAKQNVEVWTSCGPNVPIDKRASIAQRMEDSAVVSKNAAKGELDKSVAKFDKHCDREIARQEDIVLKLESKENKLQSKVDGELAAPFGGNKDKIRELNIELADTRKELDLHRADLADIQSTRDRYRDGAAYSESGLNAASERAQANRTRLGPGGELGERNHKAQAALQQLTTMNQLTSNWHQSLNTIVNSSAQMGKSVLDMISSYSRAREHEYQAQAQDASAKENEDADFQRSVNDLINSTINTMKEYLQAKTQAEQAIIRNM